MEIYYIPQLADMLRVNRNTVRAYLKEGRLAGRKVGRRWLVCDDAVKAFLMNAVSDSVSSSGNILTDN